MAEKKMGLTYHSVPERELLTVVQVEDYFALFFLVRAKKCKVGIWTRKVLRSWGEWVDKQSVPAHGRAGPSCQG